MKAVHSLVCAFVAGTALVGSLLPVPALAGDAEEASSMDGINALSTFPEFASMTDSAKTNAPLVLQGTVEQITGATMPGAQVLLWAWPSNESVRALPIGGELALIPMARTVADSAGRYELRATVTQLLRSFTSRDGLDISLDVFHADRHYTYLSQVTPTAEGKWIRELTGLVEPVATVAETAINLLGLTLDRSQAVVEEGLGITGRETAAAGYRKPVPPGCTPFEKVGTHLVPEIVATAIARNGATAEMVYDETSHTESSTGSSIGGAFSINGSRSRTFGFRVEFRPRKSTRAKPVNVDYLAELEHAVLRRSCAKDFRGGEDVVYVTSPVGSTTGAVDVLPASQPEFFCTPGSPRSKRVRGVDRVTAATERAATYGAAFTFEPIMGSSFTGKALSGYSKSTSLSFSFIGIDENRLYWCGHTSFPRAPGQRIQGFVN